MNYSVTKVIPGKFYLQFVEYQNSDRYPGYVQRNIAAPYFEGKVDKSLITEALMTGRATLPMKYNFVFDVKPGEIIYIGDFYIDASTFPVKSIEIKNNLEHARMTAKLHPTMRSLLKYQKPVDLALQR